jgi:hypothetical protein
MGREIRMVPPNWEHPKKEDGAYQPMYDNTFDEAFFKWVDGYKLWKEKKHPEYTDECEYWDEYGHPPHPADTNYYRQEFKEEPTWYQVYETVSEGTPVTPPFETKEELIDYLVSSGDFWDQQRGHGGWKRENAEKFVSSGWAPTGALTSSGEFKTARDGI